MATLNTEPEQPVCFICDNQVSSDSFPKCSTEAVFKILYSFFNVQVNSETILEKVLPKLANFELCQVCSNKLTEVVRLQDEMTQLNLQITLIKSELKRQLSSKFIHRPSAVGDLTSLGKFFAQCWSECKVNISPLTPLELNRLSSKRPRSRSRSRGQISSKSSNIPCPARFKRRRGRPRKTPKANLTPKIDPDLVTEDTDLTLTSSQVKTENDLKSPEDMEDFCATQDDDPPERASNDESYIPNDVTFDLSTSKEASKPKKKRRKRLPAKFKDSLSNQHRKEYTCRHCNESFKLKKQLKSHLASIHNDSHLPTCKFCGLDFNLKCRLPKNPDGSAPALPFFCHIDSCTCKYKTVSELRKHHHTKCLENPIVNGKLGQKFPCDLCDRSYVHMTTLRYHVHTVHEKKFKLCCEECGEGFQAPAQLKAHKIMHSTDRKFVCQVCQKSFKRSHELFYHKRTHTGETPYTCEVCGKGFRIPGKLRIHVESVHGESKYPCELCGKMFRSKAYVYMHVQATHNGQYRRSKGQQDTSDDLLKGSGQDLGTIAIDLDGTGQDLSGSGQDFGVPAQDLCTPGQDLKAPGQDFKGTVQDFKGTVQDLGAPGQNLKAPGQDFKGTVQDLSAPGQDLSAPGQDLSAPGQDLSALGQNFKGTVQDLSAPGQDLSALGQNFKGTVQDLSAPGQDLNTNDPEKGPQLDLNTSQVPQEWFKKEKV